MLADRIDLGNWRPRMHQSTIGCNELFERNLVVDGLFDDRRPSSADHENHESRGCLRLESAQNRTGSLNRFGIRSGMSTVEVAESVQLRGRLHGTGHDAFE